MPLVFRGSFTIAADQPGLEVSWQLTGVRSDPAALKQPLRVDAAKPARYRSLNAMVFLGGSVYFVNCTGPEKTVTERVGEFRAFLETLKAVK